MKSYKVKAFTTSKLNVNKSKEGESIERKIERMMTNKEPLKGDGSGLIYTPAKDGVKPEHDIRTDRFEIAVQATSKIQKSFKARRDAQNKPEQKTETGQEKQQQQQAQNDPGQPGK